PQFEGRAVDFAVDAGTDLFRGQRRGVPARMAADLPGAGAGRGDRLPAYLRHRAAARIRVLADLERALRPSDGQTALRPDRRGRDAGRAAERTAGRTRRGPP